MRRRLGRAWRPLDYVLLSGLVGLAAYMQRQPLMDIITIGQNDQEQSHIFLAPLVALYLTWLRRSRLKSLMVQPSILGPLVVLVGWAISWWGFRSGAQIAWHGGAVMTVIGALLSMTGSAPLHRFGPVFVVLIFMLPVPGEIRHRIALPLQQIATGVTHNMLEFFGVSAVRSGNVLVINGEQVAVGEACNGMRMVFALTLVVYAFAFGTPLRTGTRIALLVLSPCVAMLCNVIRLVPTSLMYGYGDVDFAQSFHDIAGWVMLPIALFMLAVILRTIRWLEFPVTTFRLASQT
ncbi:MAG: exosortase/archaeosortase family protein [Planctomycetota bacterium]